MAWWCMDSNATEWSRNYYCKYITVLNTNISNTMTPTDNKNKIKRNILMVSKRQTQHYKWRRQIARTKQNSMNQRKTRQRVEYKTKQSKNKRLGFADKLTKLQDGASVSIFK